MSLYRLAFLSVILSFLASSPQRFAEEEPYSETVDVRVINLEAVVEDAQGQRVHGLLREDFEILIDGKSHPVDYFSEIRSGEVARPAETPATPAATPAPARPPGIGDDGRVTTSYVVFVDLALSDRRQIGFAIDKLVEDLGQLPPGDKIAVFVFDGYQLANLSDWRESRDHAITALRGLASSSGANLLARTEERAADAWRERTTDDPELAGPGLENYARQKARRLEATFTALMTTLRTASPPPGRRVMLAFAGSWPRDLAVDLGLPPNGSLSGRVRAFYPKKAYAAVYETANLFGYTLYTSDLNRGRNLRGNIEKGSVDDAQTSSELAFDRDFERDATLMRYAEQTGGKAFTAGWDENTLTTVQDDLAAYYWLGFSAQRQGKDQSHKVEVRVKKPGLKVRSRQQYSDLSRKTEVDQELESRLLFSRTREKQDFVVMTGEPVVKRSEMNLPISFRIPLDLVVFLPKGQGFLADLELRVAALDERGERSPIPAIPVKLEGPKPQPGQYATYETELRLRKESRRFVLGLYDKKGDRLLLSTVDLDRR